MDELLQLIPSSERRKILIENYIPNAVAIADNYEMKILMIYWKQYIEPTVEYTCNPCIQRVLKNFKAMYERMVQLQQEENLLG